MINTHQIIELPADHFISDILSAQLPQGNTLIIAPTGAGKSTYFMENLVLWAESISKQLIVLCPLAAQVVQLKEKYQDDRFCFLSGDKHGAFDLRASKHIVATYDKYQMIRQSLTEDDYSRFVLIVDEYHKLYSAGSFRDAALNPILEALKSQSFAQVAFFTATFTPHLAQHLSHTIHQTWQVEALQPTIRQLHIINYQKHSSYHWVTYVEERLETLKKEYEQGLARQTILVRLNAIDACEHAKLYLQIMGYTVLVINRRAASQQPIQELLKSEILPVNYDVILTTALLDEAVNFNNLDHQIDSVHLVNATASPEDIIQFMGRLRKSTPEYFLHLQHGIPYQYNANSTDTHNIHLATELKVREFHSNIEAAAHALSASINQLVKDTPEKGKHALQSVVNGLNTTFKQICGCNIFNLQGRRVKINLAGTVAAACRVDLGLVYQDIGYLEDRLKMLDPMLDVCLYDTTLAPDQVVERAFSDIKVNYKLSRASAVDIAFDHFLCKIYQTGMMPGASLKQFGKSCLEHTTDLMMLETFPGISENREMLYEIYMDLLLLTQYVDNLDCLYHIVLNDQAKQVMNAAKNRAEHMIILEIMTKLRKRLDVKQTTGTNATAVVIDATLARKLVCEAFEKVNKKVPLGFILQKMPIKGVQAVSDPEAGIRFDITDSKAFLVFTQHFNVKDYNSHKSDGSRYLEITGFNWGGYHYYGLNPSPSGQTFEWQGNKYEARTGALMRDVNLYDL